MPRPPSRVLFLRHALIVFVALACSAVTARPAGATVLPPTENPLPGSNFQGADGNQDDAPPRTDWQSVQAAGRVILSPDPNDADSAFTGGSREEEPGEWAFTTETDGVNPSKSNIRVAWSAVDYAGANAFVYLAFARESALGTSFLTFELNHDARMWNNGRATIPCRHSDDVLISYEATGNDVDVVIQRWETTATDSATGCATRGRLNPYTGFRPNGVVQGAVNAREIANRLRGYGSATIPAELFGEAALNLGELLQGAFGDRCGSFGSIWMHSRSSTAVDSNMQDYVAPQAITARTCAASGTKFHDHDANGRRDPGDEGLSKWEIWADYDDDGVRDRDEPFAVTDTQGQYVINDIKPPRGRYRLREMLPTPAARKRAAAANVGCSFPNDGTTGGTGSAPGGMFRCAWGPITVATETYARRRNFGNYESAVLMVVKQLEPAADPGRFDLLVNDRVVLAGAGDGARRAVVVRPGTYRVSETATAGTNPADYRSTVECKRGTGRAQRRAGTVYADVTLSSGGGVVCTFRNVRRGSPAIAIEKTGPTTAPAGETLRYTLYVTNPGELSFPAGTVRVTDPNCDAPPALVNKMGDSTPGTLDPGDTWTYACSRKTAAPGADCTAAVVPNTATVIGTAGGAPVSDSSTINTVLTCPPTPPQPPPRPQPPPEPLVPPGPKPPDAGDAGTAGILLRRATRGCIGTRVPRVNFQGTRIARIQVYVNGSLRRNLTVKTLQRRVTPRVTLFPGRYRLAVRVFFQRGSGTPPVTLRTAVRICGQVRARTRPPFTG